MSLFTDDPAAVLWSQPTFPPTVRCRVQMGGFIDLEFTLDKVDPELLDILMYGQSPGPHIQLGDA